MSDVVIAERRHVFHGVTGPADVLDANASPFTMRLARPALRWSLRMDAASAIAIGTVAGFEISQTINAMRETADSGGMARLSARLGPDEWLLIADGAASNAIASQLAANLAGAASTLVEISHRNIAIEVVGAQAVDVLNTGCPLDLGGNAFPVGKATRTLFAKAEIVLIRTADHGPAPRYRIECWRSFGRYLHGHLCDSARLLGLTDAAGQ